LGCLGWWTKEVWGAKYFWVLGLPPKKKKPRKVKWGTEGKKLGFETPTQGTQEKKDQLSP